MANTNAYLCAYVVILLVSTVVVSLDGLSFLANFSAVLSCFNNIGPFFSPTLTSFSAYSGFSKFVLSVAMLLGRLEIYPLLLTCLPTTWLKK